MELSAPWDESYLNNCKGKPDFNGWMRITKQPNGNVQTKPTVTDNKN